MKKIERHDSETRSPDVVAENIERLKALFPEIVTEGKHGVSVNVDVLKALVGDKTVTDADEKYGLNWHGKRQARQLALTPSTGTLRPCPEESEGWDTTKNLMIEGDNLEVLKLLQKSYAGQVKLIYIDPPYNTGNDFIYPDDFSQTIVNYLMLTGQVDDDGRRVSSNTSSSGRYHTDWLNMMYPRLKVAWQLLAHDGAIFISIDDNEVSSLRRLCDEVFGEENFVATLIWQKVFSPKNTARHFSEDHDYIVCYARDKDAWCPKLLPRGKEATARYKNPDTDPRGDWSSSDLTARNYYGDGQYDVTGPAGKTFGPGRGRYWRQNFEKFKELDADGRIWWGEDGGNMPRLKRFLSEVKDGVVPQTLLLHTLVGNTQEAKKELLEYAEFEETENVLNSVKPTRLLRHLLKIGTDANSDHLVLDFFAGSGSCGHAVMLENMEDAGTRRFILVQMPERLPKEEPAAKTIADLGKSRLRKAGFSVKEDMAKQSAQRRDNLPSLDGSVLDVDTGFKVFKLNTTNIQEWEPNRGDLQETLEASIEHLKADRTESDILYELLLKLGLDLCVPIEEKKIAGKALHSVGLGVLLVCLATEITRKDAEPLALGIIEWHKELAPEGESTVVFRDSAFADDVAKTNAAAILDQYGITNVRSL
jgi:adenine-specific DNA-methyltransferase